MSGARVLAGEGGVGKSQMAAWFALTSGADLVVWVPAATAEQIITVYAKAAVRAGVPGVSGADPAEDAAAFVEWLHTTDRSWLIVLDDVTDPAHLVDRWPPHRSNGWTLATTRLREATLTGSGRQRIDVDIFTPAESASYLHDRLTNDNAAHLLDDQVPTLAKALGHLPLALSHAAAYMLNNGKTCTTYLTLFTAEDKRLNDLMPPGVDPDAYGSPVAVALLLALGAADAREPVGLAAPALALAAVCDPAGHPDTLWATPAVTDYLTAHRSNDSQPVTPEHAWAVLRTLHSYGLVTHTPADGPRAVRIHALTARAARETNTPHLADITRTVADALQQLWPDNDHTTTDLITTLRTNTIALTALPGDHAWHPDPHPLIYTAGTSLLNAGLHTPAITYWHDTTTQAQRILGDKHPSTLSARANLAFSYWQAGRTAEAIELEEQVLTDSVDVLGDKHPDTLTARANLASSYRRAGRTAEAIELEEQVLTDRVDVLGDKHPSTLIARANLASSYRLAGRTAEAIELEEQVLTDSVGVLGDKHPDTLTSRANLAVSYRQAGRTAEGIELEEQVLTDRVDVLGDKHPDTLTVRANLAVSYRQAGRTAEGIELLAQVLTDSVDVLGDKHPSTLAVAEALKAWKVNP